MTIHPDRGLVHFRFGGRLTIAIFRRAFLDFVESPDFNPTYLMLTDVREVTVIDADFATIFSAVQSLSWAFARFKNEATCVLLSAKDIHYGMARMLSQVVEIYSTIRIWPVRSEEEASVWSGLSPEVLSEILAESPPDPDP